MRGCDLCFSRRLMFAHVPVGAGCVTSTCSRCGWWGLQHAAAYHSGLNLLNAPCTAVHVYCCPTEFGLFVSLHCCLMLTPTATSANDGSEFRVRNKETTGTGCDHDHSCGLFTVGCWETCGEHLSLTDRQIVSQRGTLYCTLCAAWRTTKGAILRISLNYRPLPTSLFGGPALHSISRVPSV